MYDFGVQVGCFLGYSPSLCALAVSLIVPRQFITETSLRSLSSSYCLSDNTALAMLLGALIRIFFSNLTGSSI